MARSIWPSRRVLSDRKAAYSTRRLRAAVEAMEPRVMLSTYVVNTFIDQTDTSSSTTISLRDALARAAAHAGPDTINVPAGKYTLTQGELLVSDTTGAVTIQATGGTATLDGNFNARPLEVAANSTVSASGLTITRGDGTPTGGGILNQGNLNLSNSTVTGNLVFVENGVGSFGGGIYNKGTLSLVNVTVSNNNADGYGGAIYNTGMLTVTNSTLAGNTCGDPATGGLLNTGKATIADTTIVGNSGGVSSSGNLALGNSIIANNNVMTFGGADSDIVGPVASHGGNLIGQAGASTGWVVSDHLGTSASPLDPRVAPLGSYGGLTQTLVPLAGSAALGGGVVAAVPAGVTTDQRGSPRVVSDKVDIGAVEVQAAPLITITPPAAQSVKAESSLKANLGSFSAPAGKGPFVVDVRWGDGTPDTVFSQTTSGTIQTQNHQYIRGGAIAGSMAVTDSAGDLSNLAAFSVSVIVPPPVTVVVNTAKDQTDAAGSKTVSLRDAVALADHSGTAATISFDPAVFAKAQIITLNTTGLEISDTFGLVSLTGPAAGITINGNAIANVLTIDANVTASLTGVSITNPSGGGVENSGHLNVSNSLILNTGGGITNAGSLVLQNSTISGNSRQDNGGGLYNTGVASVNACTFSNNTVNEVEPNPGFQPSSGAAIDNVGILTLINSTLSGNSADGVGGGLYNSGTATVSDCTITANSGYGGGIANSSTGLLTLANSIVAANNADVAGGIGPDVFGAFHSLGHNLIGNINGQNNDSSGWISSDHTGTTAHPLDPKLSPLGDYGGPTLTQFPQSSSPALGAGSAALIPSGITTDQRGYTRVVGGKVDIGAVELQHASTIAVTAPAKQNVVAGASTTIQLGSFTDPGVSGPYTAFIIWGDHSPNASFAVTATGSVTFKHAFINTGSITGTISVHDKAGDISSLVPFSISSTVAPPITIVVNTIKDQTDASGSATVSLRDAINRADGSYGPVAITFNTTIFGTAQTISLGTKFPGLMGNVFGLISLVGPAAGVKLSGGGFSVAPGVTASLANFTISNGAGVSNAGTLAINNCTISANANLDGAGIDNTGKMTLSNSTVSGNTSTQREGYFKGPYYFGGQGGGIYNSGSMTIANSVISNNKAQYGGGIYNSGWLTLTGSTVANNAAKNAGFFGPTDAAGGIDNSGTLTVNACTISGNSDASGQGGGIVNGGAATLINSTVANNTGAGILTNVNGDATSTLKLLDCTVSGNIGGGITMSPYGTPGKITLGNTIIAGNIVSSGGTAPDISGPVTSLGHNLIGKKDGSTGWVASDLTGTIAKPLDAKLSILFNFGGLTQTMLPLSGSPALGAGSVALIPAGVTTDQRGLTRIVNGKVDIGAVEIQKETPFSGSPASFGLIQAENFDLGGPGAGYYNPQNINKGGIYRPTEGVGITPIPAAGGGGFALGYTDPGEYLNYTVSVAATGTYTLQFRVASQPKGGTFHLNIDGKNATGTLSIPATGNYNTYVIVSKTGVSMTAGTHVLQLVIDSAGTGVSVAGNFDWIQAVKT